MDFIKVYERIRERGMEAEWGTLNNGLPQISVRVLGITFFVVPDHFPGYEKAESDFICLRTFMPMGKRLMCATKRSLMPPSIKLPAISEW